MEKETALKVLRELHGKSLFSERIALETLIPEIVESEGERIKKEIIRFIQMEVEDEMVGNKWLAWLEKQGETSKQSVNTLEWTKDDADTLVWLCRIIYRAKQDRLITQEEENFLSEWIDKWLNHSKEKQGEQSDFNVKDYNNIDPHFAKPINKIEPKFKTGDLVVDNSGYVWKIEEIINQFCILEGVEGGESRKSHPTIEWVNKTFHLWTIQDAKEGDVLSINWHEGDDSWGKIIIFKKYHNEGVKELYNAPCVEGYGNTFKNGKLINKEAALYYSKTWTCNLHPATKEQREFFFQKMKEAGYEWDAEKKDVRKIDTEHSNYCKDNCKGFQETGKCLCDGDCKDKIENDLKKM